MPDRNTPSLAGPRTPEEAVEMACPHYGWCRPDGSAGQLIAREFSHGYIILPDQFPPAASPSQPAPAVGCAVIDKEDGRIMHLPYMGVEGTAEFYLQQRGPRG